MVAVGSPTDGSNAGSVAAFSRNNSSGVWSALQTIAPADISGTNSYFGTALHLDGDFLAIGAPYQDQGGVASAGSVYIFVYAAGSYLFQQKIVGTLVNANFGYSVCLDGNNIAIGAPFKNYYTNGSPNAYVYARTGDARNETGKFHLYGEDGGDPSTFFGLSVSLKNNWLFIGNPGGYTNIGVGVFNYVSGKQCCLFISPKYRYF